MPDLAALYVLVSDAIRRAEDLDDEGLPSAEIYFEVSLIEEQISAQVGPTIAEGSIARRGAVRAALSAGATERAEELVQRYSSEPAAPDSLREDLARLMEAGPDPVAASDLIRRRVVRTYEGILMVPERVIFAPAPGRFRPIDDDVDQEKMLHPQQVIGFVEGKGHSTPVRSPARGLLMRLLAQAGQQVREGQPIAWLRLAHDGDAQ